MTSVHAAVERDRPIGVFDSGFGGLTVAAALSHRLPEEALLYFGDTARVPYGSKSRDVVRGFSREAARFLLSRDIKLLVVACNTATAHAEEMLRAELDIPVVGVIEPGADAAVAATRTGRIGVIGTAGTIASGAYDLAVRRRLGHRLVEQAQPVAHRAVGGAGDHGHRLGLGGLGIAEDVQPHHRRQAVVERGALERLGGGAQVA